MDLLTTLTSLRVALFATCIAGGSTACPQFDGPYSLQQAHFLSFPSGMSSPSALVHANLDGDFREDIIILDGSDLVVFFAAGTFNSSLRVVVPQGAVSIAVLPGNASGGQDALVTVGPAGLLRWEFDLASDSMVFESLAISGWEGVQRLVSGDIQKDGLADDVAGISADGYSVLIASNLSTAVINYPPLPSSEKIFDLTFLDAYPEANDDSELAMVRESSVLVLDSAGTLSAISLPTMTAGRAAVLQRVDASGLDRLAVAALDPSLGEYTLSVISPGLVTPPVSLRMDDLVGLAAGDIDGDGLTDLVISNAAGRDIKLLHAEGDGSFFAGIHGTNDAPTITDVDETAAEPMLADMDFDGSVELVYPTEMVDRTRLGVYKKSLLDGAIAAQTGISVYSSELKDTDTDQVFNDNLVLVLPAENPKVPSLECIVWIQEYGAQGLNRFATRIQRIKNPQWGVPGENGGQPAIFTLDESMDGEFPLIPTPVGYSGEFDSNGDGFFDHDPNFSMTGDHFFYEVRPVKLAPSSQSFDGWKVVEAGPSSFSGHFSQEKDMDGSSGYLEAHWPGLFTVGADGAGGAYDDPGHLDTLLSGDAVQEDYVEMLELAVHVGTLASVRVLDPSGVPLPLPPKMGSDGRPVTTTAVGPANNLGGAPL